MQTLKTPDWLRRLYGEIQHAAIRGVGAWAQGYSHGYIKPDEGDFPEECPDEFPVWEREETSGRWIDWAHKDMYAEVREIGDAGFPGLTHEQRKQRFVEIAMGEHKGPLGFKYFEFHFGTYAVFRVTAEQLEYMNEGYEDKAGSENERIIEDEDHRVVVYML